VGPAERCRCGERFNFLGAAKLFGGLLQRRRHGGAHFVEQLAHDRLLFLAERFHLLAPGRDGAAAPEIAHAHGVERFLVLRVSYFPQCFAAKIFQWMRHEQANVERSEPDWQPRSTLNPEIVGQAHRLPFFKDGQAERLPYNIFFRSLRSFLGL